MRGLMIGSVFGSVLASLSLGPSLALASPPPPERVWVFFRDPGRTPAELEAELAARRLELGTRTLLRRAKVRTDDLVDARDLLPAAHYVAAVEHAGAQLRHESRWLNAVSVEADADTQRALAALPFVRGLHPVARAQARGIEIAQPSLAADPIDYGVSWAQLDLLGVPALHDCGLTGAGVLIGVQDSGFLLDHQAYASTQVIASYDFLNQDVVVSPEPGDPDGQHMHGSWVLATITGDDPDSYRGVAPGVEVLLAKTEDTAVEQPFEEDVYVVGLEWIEAMGADIFTASLIYSDWYMVDDLDGASAVSTVAIEIAVADGLIVFTSMGNAGPEPSTLGAPADAEAAISVGATNVMGQLAGFSSRGPTADGRIKPDVVGPGWDIYTVDPTTSDGYVTISGTSFSTPITAGVGALLLEAYPWLTPAQMADLLRGTASQADLPDNDYGYGLVDAVAAADLHCHCVDLDGDHFFDQACGGTDCVDADPNTNPDASELCNGLDDDCDGEPGPDELDLDADGFFACADDCDDADPGANPQATELCGNDVDDDCDALLDALDPDCMDPAGDGDGDPNDETGSDDSTNDSGASEGSDTGETGETGAPTDAGADVEAVDGCTCSTTGPRNDRLGGAALVLLAFASLGRRRRPGATPTSRGIRSRWRP